MKLLHGDCLDVLKELPDNSVDAVVTDPPYGLKFMGKKWDYDVPSVEVWRECLRVLKPGGHLLSFAGSRTYHRMTCAIEDAGFEVRDQIMWVYGSGFPKSLDVSKAIDKMYGSATQRENQLRFTEWMRSTGLTSSRIDEITGTNMGGHYTTAASQPAVATRAHLELLRPHITDGVPDWVEQLVDNRSAESENFKRREFYEVPTGGLHGGSGNTVGSFTGRQAKPGGVTDAARQWEGWGTSLKPSHEPVCVARKPLMSASVNVLDLVESQLRERGVRGEILWKPESASAAEKSKRQTNSSPTEAQPVAVTSARNVAESVTQNDGPQTLKNSEPTMPHGANQSVSMCANTTSESATNYETKCLKPTGESAPAAESVSETFSQSTTSTAEAQSIGSPSTGRSTTNSSEKDSQPDTECFAGIATGLTGSMGAVHISRDSEGFFLWPKGLPELVPGSPLTVAANVLAHGTGALNIDSCRVGWPDGKAPEIGTPGWGGPAKKLTAVPGQEGETVERAEPHQAGRWPANFIHNGSEEVTNLLGDAARFFYCAKASKKDRDEGLEGFAHASAGEMTGGRAEGSAGLNNPRAGAGRTGGGKNTHPTVKPTELMRYLCRLVTPPGGTVLDPFMGSGSTGKAAVLEGFRFIGIEREAEYLEIAQARIKGCWRGERAGLCYRFRGF